MKEILAPFLKKDFFLPLFFFIKDEEEEEEENSSKRSVGLLIAKPRIRVNKRNLAAAFFWPESV